MVGRSASVVCQFLALWRMYGFGSCASGVWWNVRLRGVGVACSWHESPSSICKEGRHANAVVSSGIESVE